MSAEDNDRRDTLADRVMKYLSNGFVLLILGALITSGLVPYFQRGYEERKQRADQMQQCFEQFLLYANSIWHEYYAVLPLSQRLEIDSEEYAKWLKDIAAIKLKRYDAYARVEALALSYRGAQDEASEVEDAIRNYAVRVNAVSAEIDSWVRNLYCTPTKRDKSPCDSFDPGFEPFAQYEKIKQLVLDIGNQGGDRVAGLMVRTMNRIH